MPEKPGGYADMLLMERPAPRTFADQLGLAEVGELPPGWVPTFSPELRRSPMEFASDLGAAISQGLTFGTFDELMGAGSGLASMARGDGFQQGYDDRVNYERQREAGFREDHPVLAGTAEAAGALPLAFVPVAAAARGATLPARAAGAGAAGAAEGYLYGFNSAEGGPGQRAADAVLPALVGAGLGAGVPMLAGVAEPVSAAAARWLRQHRNPGVAPQETLASRAFSIYDPPDIQQRSVEEYYGGRPQVNERGEYQSPEGFVFDAPRIVGRGGPDLPDVPITKEELDAFTEATTGQRAAVVPSREIDGDAGRLTIDRATRRPILVRINRDATQEQRRRIHGHENGHILVEEMLQNGFRTDGLMTELKSVYNELNNWNASRYREAHPEGPLPKSPKMMRGVTPETFRYKPGQETLLELLTEAVRAYKTNPNWFKTVAPKTAAEIRRTWNPTSTARRTIQFNAAPATTVGAGGLTAAQLLLGDDDAEYRTGRSF